VATIPINLKTGAVERPRDLIVGIDLGTTNSLVAFMQNGVPVCVKSRDGQSTLVPSVLHFAPDGGILVGDAAREKLVTDPADTIYPTATSAAWTIFSVIKFWTTTPGRS
jgi:molecular chaperone HscA